MRKAFTDHKHTLLYDKTHHSHLRGRTVFGGGELLDAEPNPKPADHSKTQAEVALMGLIYACPAELHCPLHPNYLSGTFLPHSTPQKGLDAT